VKNVRVEMPAALADMFIRVCDDVLVDSLANAGANDFFAKDTPDNREVLALIESEYRDEEPDPNPTLYDGELLTQDSIVLAAVLKRFKNPLE